MDAGASTERPGDPVLAAGHHGRAPHGGGARFAYPGMRKDIPVACWGYHWSLASRSRIQIPMTQPETRMGRRAQGGQRLAASARQGLPAFAAVPGGVAMSAIYGALRTK
jgi:hypothetical protein